MGGCSVNQQFIQLLLAMCRQDRALGQELVDRTVDILVRARSQGL